MQNKIPLILFDASRTRADLLPFTFTRTIADIRIGILTIREKWEKWLSVPSHSLTEPYLADKFPTILEDGEKLYINGSVLPDQSLVNAIEQLSSESALKHGDALLAFKTSKPQLNYDNFEGILKAFPAKEYTEEVLQIQHCWDIFKLNGKAMELDFTQLTHGRTSDRLSDTNTFIGHKDKLFIEEGASVEACILNTSGGCIYIGKDAEVMEGSVIRGPFALCEHATLKLSTKIYGATTIGPHCKVGGEVNNSVIFGFSNKAHDGFLGNSVIGEWCNLGADTNNSNLKNNYGNVKLWSYRLGKEVDSGLQFCGLMMGDHSKCGINTMFNTGTVVGVSANIFGGGFPPKLIASFHWGGSGGFEFFQFDKAIEVAERVMSRRGLTLSEADKQILREVHKRDCNVS